MPIYTYHCDSCDHEFDKKQHFSDENLTQCPECHEGRLRRVYKPARIVFKGSGFYSTDNKSSRRSVPGANGPETKTESKEKPESKIEKNKETTEKKSTEKKNPKKTEEKKR